VKDALALEDLLAAAARAPSGDNTQPWSFATGESPEGTTLEIRLDPARDPSPMNAGQRMARIALGAALENLIVAARARGLDARPRLEGFDGDGASDRARAVVTCGRREPKPSAGESRSAAAIPQRVTNRKPYDRRPVEAGAFERIARAVGGGAGAGVGVGVATLWITGRGEIEALASLAARADATLFGERSLRRAFLKSVRFDRGVTEAVEEGMPVGSLELSWIERVSLPWLGRAPSWALALGGSIRIYAAHVRRLVESASGICAVTVDDARPESDVEAGRAVERAWLALSSDGLAAQPMMSLLVLENIADHGLAPTLSRRAASELPSLRAELREILGIPASSGTRPAFLLRFGHAPPPTARTGRRGSTV
jgi:hypothetical protein